MPRQNTWFGATPDSDYMFRALTDGTVQRMSGGRIPRMNAAQASGLIGSWIIESGRSISNGGFRNFDVIEAGAAAGRGISQYTNVRGASWGRRSAYDQAARTAQQNGINPNSAQFQLQFFVDEYLGKYDRNGQSLTGWTRVFERMPQNLRSAAEYARYFTGSAREGRGYFRPGTPHQDRRNAAAEEVFRHYSQQQQGGAQSGNRQAPAARQPAVNQNQIQRFLNHFGIRQDRQSFNTDRFERVLGSVAAGNATASDVGFAIFASNRRGSLASAERAWRDLGRGQRQRYNTAGGAVGLQISAPSRTHRLPSANSNTARNSAREYNSSTSSDLSIRGVQPGDIGYGTNNTRVGGLPGLHEIAQAGIANFNWRPDRNHNAYTNPHYRASNSRVHARAASNLSGAGGLSTSAGSYRGLSVGGYGANGSAYGGGTPSYASGRVATGTGMGSISGGAGW